MAAARTGLTTRHLSAVPAQSLRSVPVIEAARPAVATPRPRLVVFYSRASGRCRRVEGFVAQVLQRRANHDTFALERVEAAERPGLHRRFGIEMLPTLIVVEGNRVVGRLADPGGCGAIERFLAPWLR